MSEVIGYENTKEVMLAGLELGNGIGKSLEDGELSVGDLTNFIEFAKTVPAAVAGLGEIKKELADLDDAEKAELLALAVEKFDIPQDKVEKIVEAALQAGFVILNVVLMLKNAKAS